MPTTSALLLALITAQPITRDLPPNAVSPAIELQVDMTVDDPAGVPADWLRQAQEEMTRIYGEIGVRINWQAGPLAAQCDIDRGADDVPAWPPRALLIAVRRSSSRKQEGLENVMGFAVGTASERAHVVYVLYDSIDQFPVLYRGLMLGHIMAHEVGHALLPLQSHSSHGLMRAQWNRADLELAQAHRLRFTPGQAELIRGRAVQLAKREKGSPEAARPCQ